MSIRLRGPSERLGTATVSERLSDWSIDKKPTRQDARLLQKMGESTLLLASNAYVALPNDANLRASFIDKEEFGLGREDSQHQVRFGQLILNGQGVHEAPDFVAVKPFEQSEHLYNEWAASAYANGLSDKQLAYQPLAIYNDTTGTPNLVSLYEHGVTTYDSVFWTNPEEHPEVLEASIVRRAAETCMRGLGLMHGARLVHGDARVKNLGHDRNGPRFVDLEEAFLIPADGVNEREFTDKVLKDMSMFIDSLRQVDENVDQINDTLHNPEVVNAMLAAYQEGLDESREGQEVDVPNYGHVHGEAVRSMIESDQ